MFSGKKTPEEVEVAGKRLTCQMCGHAVFWRREARLSTAILAFLNLEWAGSRAVCYVCERCGYIYWFLPSD